MKLAIKWRVGAIAFVICALLFATFNNQLEYFFDASGLSGKDVVKEVTESKKAAPALTGIEPVIDQKMVTAHAPPWNRLYCVKAKPSITIDGKADDWRMRASRFVCNDCLGEHDSLSAWMSTMFDDENFYVFARVRHPRGLKTDVTVDSDLTNAEFVQARLLTDLATAINIWRDKDGKGVVQLHYYMPSTYPRPVVQKKDGVFSADDILHRDNGLAKGVRIGIQDHRDGKGVDLECAVPWKLLCRDISERPEVATYARMSYAAQLQAGVPIHVVQLKTDQRRRLYHTFFTDIEPQPSLVYVEIGKEPDLESRVFKTTFNDDTNRFQVDWSRSFIPESPGISELPVTPAPQPLSIDGSDEDWPNTAQVLVAERLSQEDGAFKLQAAADNEAFYLYATIYDVTPLGNKSSLTVRLKTDQIRTLHLNLDSMTVNGVDALAAGAKMAATVGPSCLSYSLEAAIPWTMLTDDGRKPESFPITGYASLNPVWTTTSFAGNEQVTLDSGKQERWALARLVDAAPETAMPVELANGMVYDISAGIPETMSYFDGLAVRFPYGTWNPAIDVIPGTPQADGRIDDWDLSGGIFLCRDLHLYRTNNAVWIHAMYDAEYLHILYRFIDNTPMSNTSAKKYLRDDMAEFRMSNGTQMVMWASTVIESQGGVHSIVKVGETGEAGLTLAGSIKTAYQATPEGYAVEASIPWDCLGGPRKAGDSEPVYWIARTTPRQIVSDPSAFASCVAVEEMPDKFGMAVFREKGPVVPRPCHLANGTRVPVVMRDGKPQLDLSQLK